MRSMNNVRGKQRGVVYVEFLLVFPPLFMLFLVILQWSILGATSLGVRHAASAAVRSATVVLPDDPAAYDGLPTYMVPVDGSCSEGFLGKADKLLGTLGLRTGGLPKDGKCPGGPRMDAIRFAATIRMIPFAPNARGLLPESVTGPLESLGAAGWIAAATIYSYGATSVNIMFARDNDTPMLTVGGRLALDSTKPVTVRVTYLAHCGIPIARYLMCDSSHSLNTGKNVEFLNDISEGNFSRAAAVSKRVKRSVPSVQLLSRGVGNHALLAALMLSGERFMILSADATLPMNSAPYQYKEKQ